MSQFVSDFRYGIRMLSKTPALSGIAILTFALGIGLTTTVFSIVNGAMYKGLPFPESNRVVAAWRANPSRDIDRMGITLHDYVDWNAQQSVFEGLALYGGGTVNLVGPDGKPERYEGARVTANMFDVLRVQPALGRGFLPGEDQPGGDPVMIIGFDVWQEQFDGSEDVIGLSVRANGGSRTIVGVAPEGFQFPSNQQLWAPIVVDPESAERGSGGQYNGFGRLADGVSLDRAEAELATITSRLQDQYPESNEGVIAVLQPFTKAFLGSEAHALLYTMLAAVIGVLLIACANVANLLFARSSIRTKELAVRTALGARRSTLVFQMLTEVLVLALVGGLLGVAIGYGGIEWFKAALAVDPPPFWMTFDMDTRVLVFVALITAFAAISSGLVPALRASGAGLGTALKDEGRGSSSFRMGRFSGGLVVAEVAVSCGLLIVAGLMVKSVVQLKTIDLPFAVDNVFTARINLPEVDYPDTASRVAFYDQLLPELQAIAGAEAVTLSDGLPASGNGSRVFEVEGEEYSTDRDFPVAREGIVTPGYFDTFETTIFAGRGFGQSDHMESLRVAVVNESFAAKYFGDRDPLGRRIRMGRREADASWLTVIGVVPDMKMEGIDDDGDDPSGFYIPIAQSGVGNFVSIAVRTRGEPMSVVSDVREAVLGLDPNLPIYRVASMSEIIKEETWFYGVFGTLFMAFGFTALFLASVGLYGVMSFSVSRRQQEIGIRMALGGYGGSLVRLVMRRGVVQLTIGLVIGLVLAALAAGPIQIVLYEVNGRDPLVFAAVVVALASTGLFATFIPARRVTRVNPSIALMPG